MSDLYLTADELVDHTGLKQSAAQRKMLEKDGLRKGVHFFVRADGPKNFELRKNDRDFRVGDALKLREWNPIRSEYSGAWIKRRVTYVLFGGSGGLATDFVVMGLEPVPQAFKPVAPPNIDHKP